ncbi:class I SAM-dependent methyltransferase [Inconstantimicrobium mannanitabidum]|uniref:S-adenosylmethionine-dependent methyltransferase n=1 Tax=Inconstantimicrobium mannanitabidum TaxID=1604901 RepID=A0ACB5RBA7_9CLOT|nr:class I SAM-dependent methyltransferase [Clostridium sp. TW13]GKX66400.1 S-adenosylmethionine-dependent methyltransferase [Clostridium sp. TW13]
MNTIFRQNQLYTFLLYCNDTYLNKEVLDCGAGGNIPPLAIFSEQGYKTYGIDISSDQISRAKKFEEKNNLNLAIKQGDMRSLPFKDGSISFIYSYNSIFHMRKEEIRKVIKEIHRVLPLGGLAFINFASTNDWRSTIGECVGQGEYLQEENGQKILHSYFAENEAEKYFEGFKIIYKENRIREGYANAETKITLGFIDYIVEKI